MKLVLKTCVILLGLSSAANADIWKWVDAQGITHFVDTMTPIYTWTDEFGKHHYGDTPGHEDAVSVELFWHSIGNLEDAKMANNDDGPDGGAIPGETPEQRAERKQAEAYYCKRATEIYDSYVNAPQLYRTGEDGEREYLSKQDAARKIAETRSRRDELCS